MSEHKNSTKTQSEKRAQRERVLRNQDAGEQERTGCRIRMKEEMKYKFIADRMLGKLCVWLRILGYDTLYAGQLSDMSKNGIEEASADKRGNCEGDAGDAGDAEDILLLKIAMDENRILLTRDKRLAESASARCVRCVLVRSDKLDEQLRELASSLNLNLEPVAVRCSECNGKIRPVREDEIEILMTKEYVPKALIRKTDFWICERCGRIYWEGSHWRAIRSRLERIRCERGETRSESGEAVERAVERKR